MVSPRWVKRLSRALGRSKVLDRLEDRFCYGFDATGILRVPDLVVRPETADDVVTAVRLAFEEGVPVTPRGAGTGYTGGAVPVGGGVVLAMERMDRIERILPEEGTAVLGAGVVNGVFQAAAERLGLFYPPDPASLEFSTLGGNIAECAGGPRALKYGVTRDYVLGLEFVSPGGDLLRTGLLAEGPDAGYDLAGLLCGSEGTLGVITRCALRVIPAPRARRTLLFSFETRAMAAGAVVSLTSERVVPSVVEFMDESCLLAVESAGATETGFGREQLVLVEVDGDPEEVAEAGLRVERAARAAGAARVWVASDGEERDRVWAMRRAISPALAKLAPTKVNEDVCVPRGRLADLMTRVEALSRQHDLRVPVFGHAGDGNLHINFLVDGNDPRERARAERAVGDLMRATLDVGGTLSGEHGIGLTKAPYLEWELGPSGMRVLGAVRRALDPRGLLNPGKFETYRGEPCS
jgi:glycolate oxidase